MPRPEKVTQVEGLEARLKKATTVILTDFRGLTVGEITQLRGKLREAGAEYRVVKNRLMRIAASDADRVALDGLLTGPTAIAFGDDEGATAKAVMDAVRPYRQVKITGALLGDRAIDADGVTRLAALPSREVLLAQLAGAFAAPLATTAGLFDAPLRDIAGLVTALADQRAA